METVKLKKKCTRKQKIKSKYVKQSRVSLTCDQCGAKFNRKHRLEAHFREHLGLKVNTYIEQSYVLKNEFICICGEKCA